MKKSILSKKFLAISVICLHVFTQALPVSFAEVILAHVENGQIDIQQNGNTTTINAQENSIAQFSRFSTNAGDILNINILGANGNAQASAAALFRIGGGMSEFSGIQNILGTLFLTNLSGFHFGAESVTNVTGGLVASTLGISNADFMAGNYALAQDPSMAPGYLFNEGRINGFDQSAIALIAGAVRNSGTISAQGGSIALISGGQVTLGFGGNGFISAVIDKPVENDVYDFKGHKVNDAIAQDGTISANGGLVVLSAAAREEIFDRMINIQGTVEAKSLEEKDGEIILSGGEKGKVKISGNLNASASENGAKGGKINVTGGDIEVLDGAKIEALGYGMNSNGGNIFILGQGNSVLNAGSLIDASAGQSGSGGFIEFSSKSNVELAGGVMLSEAQNGKAGNILIDPADLTISTNQFTGGSNVTYQADDSITVNPGVLISSRKIAPGGDHLTAASTGNSGNITFEAPEITVGSGAKILAQADGSFTGGDINFNAHDIGGLISLISPLTTADTSITLDNATIKGKDISFSAKSDSGRIFDDTSDAVESVIDVLDSVTTFGGFAISEATSNISVKSGSSIEGRNVTFFSEAKSDAQVNTITTALGVAYGKSDATANVTLESGSSVKASNDFSMTSNAAGNLNINAIAANLGQGRGSTVDFAVAVGQVDINSTAKVAAGANVDANGKADINAFSSKSQNVGASAGAYEDGTVGVAIGISTGENNTSALMNGTLKSGGDSTVLATISVPKDDVTASASVGSDPVTGAVIKGANAVLDKAGAFSSGKTPSTASSAGGSKAALSAGFAYSDQENTSTASIGDSAKATSSGKLTVKSTIDDVVETSALAAIDPVSGTDPNVAVAGAVVVGDFKNTANAIIGKNAEVNAKNSILVQSRTSNPYEIQWDEINNVGDVVDKLNGNIGIQNGFFTSWAQSQGKGDKIGVAGSVNFFSMDNTSSSLIDEGAKINQDSTMRTQTQDVTVEALNDISTINLSGVFGLKGVGIGGGKAGLGASYLDVNYDSNVTAKIANGAQVYAEKLKVNADSLTRNISIAEAGGSAGQYAVDGSFSFLDTSAHVLAQVDDGATVVTDNGDVDSTGDTVRVTAHDKSQIFSGSGGIAKGGNVGVGASVSINNINRDTRAIIGNKSGESNDSGSLKSEGSVDVEAVNDGEIQSYSLAAAIQDASSTAPGSASPGGLVGIGISGDVAFDNVQDVTEASIRDANITKATDVTLLAKNNSDITSAAGSVAISTTQSSSFFSGGLAGSYVKNEINNQADATIDNSTVDMSGDLNMTGRNEGDILSITASGSGAAKRAIAGAVSTNIIADSSRATIKNSSDINGAKTANVTASDDSNIFAVAGSVGFSTGKSGSGSGSATNNVNNIIQATIQDSDLSTSVKTNVTATTDSDIESYAAALGADINGGASGSSTAKNAMDSTIEAYVKNKKTDGIASTGDITIAATDNSKLFTVGGNLAVNGGPDSGKGKTLAFNEINNTVNAFAENAKMNSTSGKISATATESSDYQSIGVGGVGSGGNAIAVNLVKNLLSNEVHAYITSSSDIDASGDITVEAKDSSSLKALNGTLAISANKNSVGETLAFNEIDNGLSAYIDNSSVNSTDGTLTAKVSSTSTIQALSATGTGAAGTASLAGAQSINQIDNIYDAHIKDSSDINANKVVVDAEDNSTIESLAGALSIGSKGSAGASVSTNDITNSITAYINNSTVKADADIVSVTASSASTIKNITAGGAAAGDYSAGGSVSLNSIDNTIDAHISNSSDVTAQKDVLVSATDTDTITSLAGTVTGAGTASIGAAVSTNDITDNTSSYIDQSKVKSNAEKVDVSATQTATIKNLSAGISGAGTAAIGGAVSLNTIRNTTDAHISDISGNTRSVTAQKNVNVSSADTSTIQSISGQAAGAGTVAAGGAVAQNNISNTLKGYISFATVSSAADSVAVSAVSSGTIDTISAAGSAGGEVGVAGSVSINLLSNNVQSYLSHAAVTAFDNVTSIAKSTDAVTMYGGTFSGAGTVGIGGTAVVNLITDTVKSFIDGSSNVKAKGNDFVSVSKADGSGTNESVKGVAVIAESSEVVNDTSANLSGGTVGIAANVSVNSIGDTTQAYIDSSTINDSNTDADSGQGVRVRAFQNSDIEAKGGGLSVGGLGVGAANDNSFISNNTKSYINNSTVTSKTGGVETTSITKEKVNSAVVSGGIASGLGIAGSVGVMNIGNTNEAYIKGSTVNTDGGIKVLADDDVDVDMLAGSAATGDLAGVGGSIIVDTISNSTIAHITDSTTNAKLTTEINADSSTDASIYGATGALSGYVGAAGTVSVNTIQNTTQAYIDQNAGVGRINQDASYRNSNQNVNVLANDISKITAREGNVSVAFGGAAFGASIDISNIQNTVLAQIGASTKVSAGNDIKVNASSSKSADSIAAAFSGAFAAGVAGSVSLVNIGAAISSDGNTAAKNTQSVVNGDAGGSAVGSQLGSDSTASKAKTGADAKTTAVNVNGAFSSSVTDKATTASVGNDVVLDAGSDILVNATDTTQVKVKDGAASTGILGVGGAVGIVNINNRTNALVGDRADLSAGDNVEVTSTGTVNDSDVETLTGSAGLISLGAAVSYFNSDNDVTAAVGNNVKIQKADDVKVTANMASDVRASGVGATAGAATAGLVITNAKETGTVDAHIGNNGIIGVGGGTGTTATVANVNVLGKSNVLVQAESTAASAGIISGNGSVATSTSNPTINAYIGSGATVKTTNDVTVEANGISKSKANAQGTNVASGVGIGVSVAQANSSGNISVFVGDSSTINAGRDVSFKSSFNRNTDGSGVTDAESAIARASTGGGLVGAASSNSITSSGISTWSTIGASDTVKAGRNVNINSNNYHAAYSQSDAASTGGALAVGSVYGEVGMNTSAASTVGSGSTVDAAGDNNIGSVSQSSAKTQVNGGAGKSISDSFKDLINGNILDFFTGGGLGTLLSFGGAASVVNVDNTATSTVGSNATVKAGNNVNITSDGIVDVDTFTKMVSKGTLLVASVAATDVFVDSDALINVNSGAKVSGNVVNLKAANKMDLKAYAESVSQVTVINAIASAMSRLRVGTSSDASEAKVNIAANAEITGKQSVNIDATNFQKSANLLSNAKAFADGGVAAIANTLADATVYASSKVNTDSGSKVTTGAATFHAETTMTVDRIAQSKAETVTKKIVEVIRTVVEEVCTWLPWPLDDLCDYVTKQVIDLVEVFTLSIENEKTGGSGLVSADSMAINSQIYNIGGEGKKLLVNSDGSIDPSSNIGANISDKVYVDDIANNTPSVIKFLVPKGDLSGSAVINLNKVLDKVEITNNTNKDLVINKVNMISDNGGEPDVTYNYATGVHFDVKSQEHESKLNITNNGTGDILFNNAISNQLADFTFQNTGGDIFAQNSGVVFDMYHASLRSDNGNLGLASQRLNFDLWKAVNNPDGSVNSNDASLSAFSYGNMYLDVKGIQTRTDAYDSAAKIQGIQIGDLTSFNNIDVKLETGKLYNYTESGGNHTVAIHDANVIYGLKNMTADKNVDLNIASGSKGTSTGTITSGLQDIAFDINSSGQTSSNTFNHEISRDGSKITLKDITQGGGHIAITGGGTLDGTGTLKALDGYSHLTINNASGLDLELDDLNVDTRINKSININGDTNVLSNEYGSVQVANTGYSTGAITVNNTGSGSDILLTGTLGNSSGTTSLTSSGGSILNTDTDQLIKAKDLSLNALNQIGQGTDGLKQDLTGGKVDASAGQNIILTETVGDMNVGAITSTSDDVTLKSNTGSILDADNDAAADVSGKNIKLTAQNGIGASNNNLDINTGTGALTASGSQGIYLTETVGDLNVANVNSTGGDVTINSAGAINSVANDGTADVIASVINLNASAGGIGTTSALDVTARTSLNANSASDNSGILLDSIGDLPAGLINAGTGVLSLNSTGNMNDANDNIFSTTGGAINLIGGGAILQSASGIGTSGDGIEMQLHNWGGVARDGRLEAEGGNGGIYLSNQGPTGFGLTIGSIGFLSKGLDAKGGITVYSHSPLTVNSDVTDTAGGDILLSSLGNNAADDLTLNANVNTSGGNGNITLTAGDTFSLTGTKTVTAAGSGDIKIFAGEDWSDLTQNQNGNVNGSVSLAQGARVTTSIGEITVDAAKNAAITALQTGSDALNAVSVTARSGAITDSGNSRNDITTGTNGQTVLKAAAGIGSGNALETSTGNLDAVNTTSGNVEVDEIAAGGNLGINRVDQQGAGTVVVRTLDGTLTVNAGQSGVSTKTGDVTLTANGAGANDDLVVNDTVTTTSGKINLNSNSRDVIFSNEGDVTSISGDTTVNAARDITQADGAVANSGTGVHTWTAGRDIAVGSIQNTSNSASAVVLNAGGEVKDNGDTDTDIVTGVSGQTTINAVNGVGSSNALETSTGDLNVINTASGNINIDEITSGGNLGINKVDQQGAGTVTVRTLDGTLTVNQGQSGVKATSGDVTLSAKGTGNNDDAIVNDTVVTDSGKININSDNRDVYFSSEGDVTSNSGKVTVTANRDIIQENGAIINSGTGKIDLTAGRDIALASLQTISPATDAVLINAISGEVRDNGDTDSDIIAQQGTTTIRANTGIGSGNALDTKMKNVSAVTDQGNLRIDNTGALNVVTANGVSGVSITDAADLNAGYFITLRTFSPLTITAGSPVINHAGGDINLNALGKLSSDDLTLNADVKTDGGNGNILLTSGDTTTIANGVTVSAAGTGNVTVASGEDFTDGLINQDGNTGIGGGDVIMGGTAQILTQAGNVTVDAADDFIVGIINTNSDNNASIGDAFATTHAGSILDANGPDMNITADELTLDSAGTIGVPGDPIETSVRVLKAISVGSMFFFNVGNVTAQLRSLHGSIELEATGNIFLSGVFAVNGTVLLKAGNSILSNLGGGVAVAANDIITLIAGGTIGESNAPVVFNLENPATVFASAGNATAEGLSVNLSGNILPSSFEFLNLPPGLVLLNGIAVGGGTFSLMAGGISTGLYGSSLPPAPQNSGIFDGRFAADFPGAFNSDNFSINLPQNVDTSALENLSSMPAFEVPPTVVPLPKSTGSSLTVTEENAEEVKKEETNQKNPPTVVPVPADAQSTETIKTENQ